MSNAKRCDICGKYFEIPEFTHEVLMYGMPAGAVRLYKKDDNATYFDRREGTHFDACDDCVQDVLDYILRKKADANWQA